MDKKRFIPDYHLFTVMIPCIMFSVWCISRWSAVYYIPIVPVRVE